MNINKILIGIDDSVYAENAAKYGFELAHKFDAHVGLVNVVEPVVFMPDTNDGLLGLPLDNMAGDVDVMNAQNNMSDNIINKFISQFGGELQVTHFNQFGATADGILECAVEFNADIIIIGTHHRSGLDRFLMGSTAESVVRNSVVPVLVVPTLA
jgi:nucleotide-binding universal stress UspA family protein